jgi:excinuclease ABC subunit C
MGRLLIMKQEVHAEYELDFKRLQHILPKGPGVYLFKDLSGRVIYIGKAKNLKKRVLTYLKPAADLHQKTGLMIKNARSLDFILTYTEKEALILESNLIKKHMPRYNIVLRDDKQYPCIRMDIKEPYPRLRIVRTIRKDGAIYFGPFSSANSVRNTLKVIDRVFQLRKCKGKGLPKRGRPCLNYQMDRCLGPCTHDISVPEYQEVVRQVRLFLEGRNLELLGQLMRAMEGFAERMEFERAARVRDQVSAIKRTIERQNMVSPRMEDQDIVGVAQEGNVCQVVVLYVRKGYLTGTRNYAFKELGSSGPSEVMESFLKQYYSREVFKPREILISEPIQDLVPIMEWLSDSAGRKVVIRRPQKGGKAGLVAMATNNARRLLEAQSEQQDRDLLSRMQSCANLKSIPRFIEGVDVSHLKGDIAVGTIVSFVDGQPHRPGYRNYRLVNVNEMDDYAMMAELVRRRLSSKDLPDLLLVDGGRGHLSAVRKVLDQLNGPQVPDVVSIAKADESRRENCDKIYVHGRRNPLSLRPDDPVLLLFMRIRDEAHRRAISYHRRLRGKNLTQSELDFIPNIGVKRKKILLKYFGKLNAVSEAGMDQLGQIPGIGQSLARDIFSFFHAKRGVAPFRER